MVSCPLHCYFLNGLLPFKYSLLPHPPTKIPTNKNQRNYELFDSSNILVYYKWCITRKKQFSASKTLNTYKPLLIAIFIILHFYGAGQLDMCTRVSVIIISSACSRWVWLFAFLAQKTYLLLQHVNTHY